MNLIYTNNENHYPVNLDSLDYIAKYDYNSQFEIYFKLRQSDVTWSFKTIEERDLYTERILSLLDGTNISKMTTL